MSGTTPISSYIVTNNSSMTNTVYLTALDGNSVAAARGSAAFAPYGSTAMTVNVMPGHLFDGATLTESSAWTSSVITAPVSNSRIDRIVLDQLTGAPSIVTGTAAGSPVAPAIPIGKVPCAQIVIASTTTAIGNSLLTDERDLKQLGGNYSGLKLLNYAADTGSTNAFAVAPTPAISAYATGQMVELKLTNGQTGAATLAVSGLAATPIKTMSGATPSNGMMVSGGVSLLAQDGTNFQLLNPIINSDTIPISTATTNNMSSAARGFAPVGNGSSLSYLSGKGAYTALPATPVTITLGTPTTLSTGTSINLGTVASSAKRVTVMFNAIKQSTTSDYLIQFATSSGTVASGYVASAVNSAGQVTAYTTGFGTRLNVAVDTNTGTYTFNLSNSSNNTWVGAGIGILSGVQAMNYSGAISLPNPINSIVLTTLSGAGVFASGEVNISYE